MPGSSSSTKISGTGTPEAIAISSTTLRKRRYAKSVVSAGTRVAPSCNATAEPPERKVDIL